MGGIVNSILNAEIRILISKFGAAKRDREVAVLVNEKKAPGHYAVPFDATGLASGVFFYRLQAPMQSEQFLQTRKLLFLRQGNVFPRPKLRYDTQALPVGCRSDPMSYLFLSVQRSLVSGGSYMKGPVLFLFLFLCYLPTLSVAQQPLHHQAVTVYTTADKTEYRLTRTDVRQFVPAAQPLETEIFVFVNPTKTFQTFLGIGGAITDAAAEVFATLSPAKQLELLTAYYDTEKGIGYTLGRTSIHSCDFSSESYTYINEGDKELKTFSIQHDKRFRIPLIRRAIEAAGGNLTLFASPWSPPAFMKDSKSMLQGGKLLPEYHSSWARYITTFIKAYEAEGIPIWGITVQNEPMATQKFESCIFTAEEERDFLKLYLGPTMAEQELASKHIIVWDHNRDLLTHRAHVILDDPEAAKYVWGVGFHWYETWTGGKPMFDNVRTVHESYPDKKLFFTEGCVGSFDPERYQYWPNAEQYGSAMINDFNNGTVGWTDWNILLDETGGPNHVQNFCFAPIHADTKTGELIFTPSYYYIGHFSKFIRPNARRVSTTSSRSILQSTSFVNSDGSMITVVMNESDTPFTYKLIVDSISAELTIPARGIQTMVY